MRWNPIADMKMVARGRMYGVVRRIQTPRYKEESVRVGSRHYDGVDYADDAEWRYAS